MLRQIETKYGRKLTVFELVKESRSGEVSKNSDPVTKGQNYLDSLFPSYEKKSNIANSLFDIDDPELIDLYIDDPSFRKEYGVSDAEYKKIFSF